MIVIIIKDNQWTTTNNNTEPLTMNREPWTFFQWWWSYPSLFSYFIFLRRRSYPSSLHLSILWSSPGGEELLVATVPHQWTTTIILWNNNTEPWTFFSVMVVLPLTFFQIHFLRRRSYPSSLHLSILWSSPAGKDLLVFTGGGAGRAQKSPHDAGR